MILEHPSTRLKLPCSGHVHHNCKGPGGTPSKRVDQCGGKKYVAAHTGRIDWDTGGLEVTDMEDEAQDEPDNPGVETAAPDNYSGDPEC